MFHNLREVLDNQTATVHYLHGGLNPSSHWPCKGRGFRLSSKIAGRGIMLPDAAPPVEIRTFVPSSKYLYVTRQGALHQNKQIHK